MDPLAVKTMMMTLKGLKNPWFPFTRKKHISEIKPGDVVVFSNMLYLVTSTEYAVINKIEGFNISKSLYLNTICISLDYINSSESYYRVLLSTRKIHKLLESVYSALIAPVYVTSAISRYVFLNKTKHGCNLLEYYDGTISISLDIKYNKQDSLKIDNNITSYTRKTTSNVKDIIKLMLLYLDNASK